MRIKVFIAITLLFSLKVCAQDSTEVFLDKIVFDSIASDSLKIIKNQIVNANAIQNFYSKLNQLEKSKNCKLRVVHIGDSHIQADLFTGKMRALLQKRFGNGGLGFTFPYNLAKTNGNHFIKYNANINFESFRNVFADNTNAVGLSGISLETKVKNFAIEVEVRDKNYVFNTIKLVTPKNEKLFDLATTSKEIKNATFVPKTIYHKIKRGEAISIIAQKYNISIATLKKANGLKSNNIQAGKTLKIPTNEMQPQTISTKEFIPVELNKNANSFSYYSENILEKIYIIPVENKENYALNGLILENNQPGIVYSAIGVNGAKASDYNKFPIFFEQLKALEADLVVISLGTNESFDKMETQTYFENLKQMITEIRKQNPAVEILVTTPPPSLFQRKYPNTFVADYTRILLKQSSENQYAVWNLFEALGGLFNVNTNYNNGLMAKDKVHYSKKGYENQGKLFYYSLINSYEQITHE